MVPVLPAVAALLRLTLPPRPSRKRKQQRKKQQQTGSHHQQERRNQPEQHQRGRRVKKEGTDGVNRRSRDAESPHFDCTRHNVRQEWSKWRDLGASGQVLEWIRHGVAVPWLTRAPPPLSTKVFRVAGCPATKQRFLQGEIERLTLAGVLRPVEYSRWVSRAFLVPKPVGSGWRLIVDLREINKACHTRKMKMETLRSLRLIAKRGDHWVSFDLKDGFYSLAIATQDIECFTVNLDGKLLQFSRYRWAGA